MLINSFLNGIDIFVKSWMLFNTLDDLISDNTWVGGTLSGGALVGSHTRNTLTDQSRFDISTGDFTIEFDYTPNTEDNNSSNRGLLSFSTGSLSGINYFIRYDGSGFALVTYPSAGGSAQIAISNDTVLTTDQKYHVAFVRRAGVYDLLIDSVSDFTTRNNSAIPYSTSTNNLYLGVIEIGPYSEYMSGKMGNFKFSNGTARY